MIREQFERDLLAKFLFERSSLSMAQVDTLMIFLEYRLRGDSLGEMIKVRDSGIVTKGSFGRSLEQARNNLRKSVYTLVFSNYMGFYDPKLLESLSKICEMLIGLKGHAVSTSKLQEITQLVEEICGGFTGQ